MAMIDIGDIRLHVQRMRPKDGRPPIATAVVIHGMVIDSMASYYLTVAPVFAASGIDVILYDQRGCGRSDRSYSGYTLDDTLDDLEALLDRLDVTGPVHLVGNSYGGTVAFSYAVRHPERVASVSVIESSPATEAWAASMVEWAVTATDASASSEAETKLLAWVTENHGFHALRAAKRAAKRAKRMMRATTVTRDLRANRVLSEDQIRSVRCPVLFLYGGDSPFVEQAPWLESLLPDCRTVVLPGHDHLVLIAAPETVGTHVLSLIQEVAGAPGAAQRAGAEDQ
jgi:pimeloyl-ACP methyl ester carboxylesterase